MEDMEVPDMQGASESAQPWFNQEENLSKDTSTILKCISEDSKYKGQGKFPPKSNVSSALYQCIWIQHKI